MSLRRVACLGASLLLGACNTGDNFMEWDEETQAIVDARAAGQEAAERGESTDMPASGASEAAEAAGTAGVGAASPPEERIAVPAALMSESGSIASASISVVPPTGDNRRITAAMTNGDVCKGGLVVTGTTSAGETGSFALSCDSGGVWLGEALLVAESAGRAGLRDQSGNAARMVFGVDVPIGGLDQGSFEALWVARGG